MFHAFAAFSTAATVVIRFSRHTGIMCICVHTHTQAYRYVTTLATINDYVHCCTKCVMEIKLLIIIVSPKVFYVSSACCVRCLRSFPQYELPRPRRRIQVSSTNGVLLSIKCVCVVIEFSVQQCHRTQWSPHT